ncbi:hypothetical protein ACFFGH_02325 [Lysobacter korlensis]|uniref:Curli production assembly/transport component CsgG n=1 Tax=Lysobacter korlensis TaxID=553636 RepID=A0ABV6RI73_9GAMM
MIRRASLRLSCLLLIALVPLQALAAPKAVLTAPHMDGPTRVEFSTEKVSKWTDLPLGTYRVPNSDVIISGHQKGGAAPMLLFGLVGVAVQGAVNAQNGKEAMASAEQALTFSMHDQATEMLQGLLAENDYAGRFTAAETGQRKFEVTGAVVLSFANQAEALPYVTLRVKLLDDKGKKVWTTRYITSEGARKPVVGEGSWTANGGALLHSHVNTMLELALRTMLKDIAEPYPRDEASLVTAKGFFPHVNKPLQVVGYKLAEENGRMLFLPKLGTSIVFAGVNVLDTRTMALAPTVKGDAPLKLLKVDDPALQLQARVSVEPVVATTAAIEAPAAIDAEVESSPDAGAAVEQEAEGGQ